MRTDYFTKQSPVSWKSLFSKPSKDCSPWLTQDYLEISITPASFSEWLTSLQQALACQLFHQSGCDNAKCQQGEKRAFQTKDQDIWLQGKRLGLLEEESIPHQFYLCLPHPYTLPSLHPFVKQVHCHTSANCFEVYRSSVFKSGVTFSDAVQASQGPCLLWKSSFNCHSTVGNWLGKSSQI